MSAPNGPKYIEVSVWLHQAGTHWSKKVWDTEGEHGGTQRDTEGHRGTQKTQQGAEGARGDAEGPVWGTKGHRETERAADGVQKGHVWDIEGHRVAQRDTEGQRGTPTGTQRIHRGVKRDTFWGTKGQREKSLVASVHWGHIACPACLDKARSSTVKCAFCKERIDGSA